MIEVAQFDRRPVRAGEFRSLMLLGDGPFTITSRCFVDQPRPPGPGFVPCPECESSRVNASELYRIQCSQAIWSSSEGRIELLISDSLGDTLTLRIEVIRE